MYEVKSLDSAIQKCQNLEVFLSGSIEHVRRLNDRYNTDRILKNYQQSLLKMTAIVTDSVLHRSAASKSKSRQSLKVSDMSRTSRDIRSHNFGINYKFVKVKRQIEAVLHQVQRAIKRYNRRQSGVVHQLTVGRSTRLCCH